MDNIKKTLPLYHSITYADDEMMNIAYCDEDITYICDIYHLRLFSNYNTEKLVIICCVKGRFEINVDGDDLCVESNQLLIIKPKSAINRIMHSINAECKVLCLSMHFVKNFIDAKELISTAFILYKKPLITIPNEKLNGFVQLVSAFDVMLDKEHIYYNKIITKLVEATLFAVFGYLQKMNESEFDAYNTKTKQGEILFRKFMSLLITKKANARNVSYYSSELFVTPKYLSHVCKEICGKTASQLIKEQVIKNIKLMLRFTNKSIKEIVQELGFPNESFFVQYVKANIGYTPIQYRNLCEN